MAFFKRLLRIGKENEDAQNISSWIRKDFYKELFTLIREEVRMKNVLNLPYQPRLTVVDERHLIVLRPQDRDDIKLDKAMHDAIAEEKQNEKASEKEAF